MRNLLLASAAALALSASDAHATLQIAISDGTHTFTCADGDGSCDLSGGTKNLETVNTTVGNFFIKGTFSTSTMGASNELSLSSFSVSNRGTTEGTLKVLVSDTGFLSPVKSINNSASLTFNNDVGAGASMLAFYADHADGQGAPGTPGTLLYTATGIPLTHPDSFAGSADTAFSSLSPFSMTEGASLDLIAGGSVNGFNQDMVTTGVPEPSTWALYIVGFGALGAFGYGRQLRSRMGSVA